MPMQLRQRTRPTAPRRSDMTFFRPSGIDWPASSALAADSLKKIPYTRPENRQGHSPQRSSPIHTLARDDIKRIAYEIYSAQAMAINERDDLPSCGHKPLTNLD